jgi:hypothetical protein
MRESTAKFGKMCIYRLFWQLIPLNYYFSIQAASNWAIEAIPTPWELDAYQNRMNDFISKLLADFHQYFCST